MAKLTKKTALLLSTGLREVYSAWIEKPASATFMFKSGICLALTYTRAFADFRGDEKCCPYVLMSGVMKIVEPGGADISFIAHPGNWSVRPTYCLLLAEYIETDIL